MQAGIAIIVLGAIGLVVFAAVSPTLFGSFGDTYQQTQAACVYQGERFTAVNTAEDWTGDDHTLKGASGNCSGGPGSGTVYTPHGVAIANGSTSDLHTNADWEAALMIMTEQGGINRLVITILPLLTVIGAIALLYSWHKSRQTA